MRIAQVLHSHGFGGAEKHALLLMLGLVKRGHDVIFVGPRDSWLAEQCFVHNIEVFHLRMAGMFDFWSYYRLWDFLRTWKADIVHGHLLRGAKYAGVSAGKAIPVCTAHATTARKHMGGCRHIIAVASVVRDNLLAAGYPENRLSLIYNGIADVPRLDRTLLRKELGIPSDVFAVFNAGRFIRDKGQDLLVSAIKLLSGAHLYLAGDDSTSFGEEVKALAKNNTRIHFLGYCPDVQRILPAFDIYASSSRREAFSLALVEAFAASLPMVATAVGGVPELIDDGVNSLLVSSENVHDLARGIDVLAKDRDLRDRLGQHARYKYLKSFTVEKMLENTESLYCRMLEGQEIS
ncbi:MAG: glycosyltransferase family 4 protein [Desulfobacter sp.]